MTKLPRKRRKKREISVRAPDYIPKRKPILKDTTGTEALDVFKVAEGTGKGFSFAMIVVGIFIVVLSAYALSSSINLLSNPFFVGVLGFVGAVNLLAGLLLLSKK